MSENDLSETQRKVLRFIARHARNEGCSVQVAGHGRAHWLSACRALERKGLLIGGRTGYYAISPDAQPIADALVAAFDAAKP